MIEVFEPSTISPEGLENTKVTTQGNDLPDELGRASQRGGRTLKTRASPTSTVGRLTTSAFSPSTSWKAHPGRDSLADATEFFRQLKPLLLDKPK